MNIRIRTDIIHRRITELMLTRADIAEAISISVKTMDSILCRGTCSPITMGRLARVLGVEPWELVA